MIKKEKEMPIGVLTIINIDFKNRNTECIIDIGEKEYWGKGYGKEGLKLLLDFAFYEMNLHRVSLKVFSFNERAIRLYTTIGFQKEGTCIQSFFRIGQWYDVYKLVIDQDENCIL